MHIKAMMQLTILRLDHNELQQLPSEIGDLQLLVELSFSDNKVSQIPLTFGKLRQLKMLNMADNQIKHLPQELGEIRDLRQLYLHGNKFTCFPCSFINFCNNLDEFSLEWFLYAKPPKPKLVKRNQNDGNEIFDQLVVLCNLLMKYKMNECALVTFLENYSQNVFNINQIDNRLRTPLHNAAVKGDNGVLEGLLLGKADANILDKDNCTPLCLAIREENFDAAVILINSNVDVNLGGGIFGSPMHLAVVKLEVWIVKKLIMNNADVNKTDCDGNTPLHLVMNVFSKNPQKCASIAEQLILSGAKVNIKNNDNWAPIHLAARKGQEKGIQTIIRLNSLLREKNLELFDLNITGGVQQWTAVHLAAHGGFIQIVKDLVQAGVDVFQRNSTNQLPRHCAKGNYILTKFLKLSEQQRSKVNYGTYHIHNQYELLNNVTQKQQLSVQSSSSSKRPVSTQVDEYQLNYDSFMTNLSQLRVIKAFSEINIVKKQQQNHHIHTSQSVQISHQTLQQFQQSLTPINKSNQPYFQSDDLTNPKFFHQNTHLNKSQVFTDPKIQSNPQHQLDSKFSKLNLKAEEKKINLFYLKDILIKDSSSQQEKLDALFKIKRNIFKPVFGQAMRSLIPEFHKIQDSFIQKELILAITDSAQYQLLDPLKLIKDCPELEESVLDEISDSIRTLTMISKNPKSYQQIPSRQLNAQAGGAHHQQSSSFDKSRNVNSFKMKGMASLAGPSGDNNHQPGNKTPTVTSSVQVKGNFIEAIADDKLSKSSMALHTQGQQAKLSQTQPMRKVLGNQNCNMKSQTPNAQQQMNSCQIMSASISNNSNHQINGMTMMMHPPKMSQMLRKKHPHPTQNKQKAQIMPPSTTPISSHATTSVNSNNGKRASAHQYQNPLANSTNGIINKMNYLISDEFRQRSSDYDEGDEGMGPSVNEYTVYSDTRQGLMNRTSCGKVRVSSGSAFHGRSHSQRNSLSIPAKK